MEYLYLDIQQNYAKGNYDVVVSGPLEKNPTVKIIDGKGLSKIMAYSP